MGVSLFPFSLLGLLFLLSLQLDPLHGQILVRPLNTAAYSGYSIRLNCSTTYATHDIYWMQYPVGSGTAKTVGDCRNGGDQPPPGYRVDRTTSPYHCDLIMDYIHTDQAGRFDCISNEGRAYAQVVIIGIPSCARNSTSNEILLGQTVSTTSTLPCYNCDRFLPVISRTPDNIGTPSSVITSIQLTYWLVVEPYIPEVPAIREEVRFTGMSPPAASGEATNIPANVIILCNNPAQKVLYAPFPENITITGAVNGKATITSKLTCKAVTYAGAVTTYRWYMPCGGVFDGSSVVLTTIGDDLLYRCAATNQQGTDASSTTVTVIASEDGNQQLTVAFTGFSKPVGSTLNCGLSAGIDMDLKYIWTDPHGVKSTNYSITLSNSGKNLKYKCEIQTEYGQPLSISEILLDVTGAADGNASTLPRGILSLVTTISFISLFMPSFF